MAHFAAIDLDASHVGHRVAWGLMSLAYQSRCTVALETPAATAKLSTDQRVRLSGGRVAPRPIRSRTPASMVGLHPRPLASARPATPMRGSAAPT